MNTKIIKLDINKKLFETITAKQGDTKSRFILFNLYDGPIQFDLTGRTVRVYGKKKDNTTIFNDLVITDAKKGYCTLELTNQMLAVEGMNELELVIFEGEKRLSTMPFILNVIGSKYSEDAIVSTNEFTALMNALKTVGDIDNKAEKKEVEKLSEQLDNIENNQGFINVKKFGVVGDGITDDTDAMQKALDYGGNLYVPDVYLLNGEMKIKSNTHLLGVNGKTIFKKNKPKYIRKSDGSERWTILASIGNYSVNNSCNNVTLENIIFDGNSGRKNEEYIDESYGDAQNGSKLIDCANVNNITLKNITVQNNNYLGSGLTSCSNVVIENFKSLNCDVGICIFKDNNTNTELKNYTFKNIFIDGHDMSEGISFYNKSFIKNVKLSDITILNKEKGTALLLGTEYNGEYGIIDGQLSNINIKNSSNAIMITQYSQNIQGNNINISDCTQGLLISNNSFNNQLTNININNIKSHGIYIGTDCNRNNLTNINIKNCNTSLVDDYKGFIVINGKENVCKNVIVLDESDVRQYLLVCRGDYNKVEFSDVKKATGTLQVHVFSNYNEVNINSNRFIKLVDTNCNYKTSITNKLKSSYNSVYGKGINSNSISLNDTIHSMFSLGITSGINISLENITLFENYRRILISISVSHANGSITLSNNGNIKWLTNDTITNGQTIQTELICIDNKWVEINRF